MDRRTRRALLARAGLLVDRTRSELRDGSDLFSMMTYHYLDEPCLRGRIHRYLCKYKEDPVERFLANLQESGRLFDPEEYS